MHLLAKIHNYTSTRRHNAWVPATISIRDDTHIFNYPTLNYPRLNFVLITLLADTIKLNKQILKEVPSLFKKTKQKRSRQFKNGLTQPFKKLITYDWKSKPKHQNPQYLRKRQIIH